MKLLKRVKSNIQKRSPLATALQFLIPKGSSYCPNPTVMLIFLERKRPLKRVPPVKINLLNIVGQ